MNLPLKANKTYFSTIRGVTNEGHVLETSSDGFTVDQTPPVIGIDRFVSIIFITLCTIHLQITQLESVKNNIFIIATGNPVKIYKNGS